MLVLGAIGFATPYALLGLLILPVLWWLLHITPPPPKVVAFPAIRLLRDLVRPEESPARTPLWLILFRMLLAALLIVGLAGPVLHPQAVAGAATPLLIVADNGWASSTNWPARQAALGQALDRAERGGRLVALVATADGADGVPPHVLGPSQAAALRGAADALQPMPWPVSRDKAASAIQAANLPADAEVLWLADGIDTPEAAKLADVLKAYASPHLIAPGNGETASLLLPPSQAQSKISAKVVRPAAGTETDVLVRAVTGDTRLLGTAVAHFAANAHTAAANFDLPVELVNEADRLEIEGQHSAGATVLLDSRWRRRPIGLLSSGGEATLLNGDTYLKAALAPFSDLREGSIDTLMKRPLSTIVLDDPAPLGDADQAALKAWIEAGGLLIRFAGPRLDAEHDQLLPVKLRTGDRALGGALSWTTPAHIAPFPANSPFAGLAVADDVTVSRQVLAEPSADLAERTWASLTDGTPLVTMAPLGKGRLVLIHTTAGPAWSNLGLSGVFVDMLHRLSELGAGVAEDETDTGSFTPVSALDGFGVLHDAPPTAQAIEAGKFDDTALGPAHPPGYYGLGTMRRAVNLSQQVTAIDPLPEFAGFTRGGYGAPTERSLMPILLAAALLCLAADALIALWLKGLLPSRRVAAVALVLTLSVAHPARAEAPQQAVEEATSTTLGYVRTGDAETDRMSDLGLKGLAQVLVQRTSVEQADYAAVDLENDDLAFFPLLYWPVEESEPTPSAHAVEKLNAYLDHGGMILFDLRRPGFGTGPDALATTALKRLTAGLDIPPLEPVPADDTLTKSFYLLSSFPGRYDDGKVWVEKSPRDSNDSVSSVIIGGNDWAAAWAADENGRPLADVTSGDDRQREMAYRFGVNVAMYALTGNYKSDQVHTPFILKRLGQ